MKSLVAVTLYRTNIVQQVIQRVDSFPGNTITVLKPDVFATSAGDGGFVCDLFERGYVARVA